MGPELSMQRLRNLPVWPGMRAPTLTGTKFTAVKARVRDHAAQMVALHKVGRDAD